MGRLSYIVLVIAMNVLICVLAKEELYPDRYDNLDVQELLTNPVVREEYYNCFMEITPCKTPEQQRLTGVFSEAYQTKCRRCTKKQIANMDAVTEWYAENEPEKWRRIVEKTINDLKKKYADQ